MLIGFCIASENVYAVHLLTPNRKFQFLTFKNKVALSKCVTLVILELCNFTFKIECYCNREIDLHAYTTSQIVFNNIVIQCNFDCDGFT